MVFIAKFRLKLKKVGKTIRLLRYDLNQIPDYTVEVRNRFKGLDLIDRVPDELWTEVRKRLKFKFQITQSNVLSWCYVLCHNHLI